MIFGLEFGPVLPAVGRTGLIQLEPRLGDLSWSTVLPGGFNGAQLTLNQPLDAAGGPATVESQDQWAVPFGHMRVLAGSFLAWEGRVMDFDRAFAGRVSGLGAKGYGNSAAADFWYSSASTSASSSGPILAAVLAASAPWLVQGVGDQFADPGIVHTQKDFSGMTPGQIAAQMVTEGGSGGQTWDYAVWDGRVVYFTARTVPSVPTYLMPFDGRVSWHESFDDVYSRVTVEYTDITSGDQIRTAPLLNQATINTWSIDRHKLLNAGTMSAAGAVAYGATWLAAHGVPDYQVSLTLPDGDGLASLGSSPVPAWVVRAGAWVQIGNKPMLPILETNYASGSGQFTATLGAPSFDLTQILADTLRDSARLAAGLQARTGARIAPW